MTETPDSETYGPYSILEEIGSGGTSTVFRAEDEDGNIVAIKVLHPHLAKLKQVQALITREAKVLSEVSGPGVARLLDAQIGKDKAYLVMEFVEGKTLETLIEKGPLRSVMLLSVVDGVLEALRTIHSANVTHRDLKPTNVILGPDGIRILDFGLSVIEELAGVTRPAEIGGTPAWISPEQILGGEVGPASDVFNLGLLIAFLATGKNPFGVGRPEAMLYRITHSEADLSELSPSLRALVSRCLAQDPKDRPNLEQVTSGFRNALTGGSADQSPGSDQTLLASETLLAAATERNGVPRTRPKPTKRFWKYSRKSLIVIASSATVSLVFLLLLDVFVLDYSGDVKLKYVNSSSQNQPKSGGALTFRTDDGRSESIQLPGRNLPAEIAEVVGRWTLESQFEAEYQPGFTQDTAIQLKTTSAELGLSRFHAGRTLLVELTLSDERADLKIGFEGDGEPLSDSLLSGWSNRGNEAKYLALEAEKEEQYRLEQEALFAGCLTQVEEGWTSELLPILRLADGYATIRDSRFDGTTRDWDDWAYRAWDIGELMFGELVPTIVPGGRVSSVAPYTEGIIADIGFVSETHSYLGDAWTSLGDSLFYTPRQEAGNLRDLYPRDYLFIDGFERQLSDAASSLRTTIASGATLVCQIEYPDA